MIKKNLRILLLLSLTLLPTLGIAAENTEAEAQRLFNALGCKACHQFDGQGGSLAPPLDQIGSRMTRTEIRNHLTAHRDPGKNEKNKFMPSFRTTSTAELELLSDFLYSHKN